MESKTKKRDPVLMLFEAVAYLHKKGYEKIRLMSFISPSGCHFRVFISLKKNFDNKTGFVICSKDYSEIYCYTTSRAYEFFTDGVSMEDASIEELATKLFTEYPVLEREGKGNDKAYADWFAEMLKMTGNGKYPYAFSDYGYDIFREDKILFTDKRTSIGYAPAGDFVR